MIYKDHFISFSVVKLLIGFFGETNSEVENEALDNWICEEDINMHIFGECLEVTLRI